MKERLFVFVGMIVLSILAMVTGTSLHNVLVAWALASVAWVVLELIIQSLWH